MHVDKLFFEIWLILDEKGCNNNLNFKKKVQFSLMHGRYQEFLPFSEWFVNF